MKFMLYTSKEKCNINLASLCGVYCVFPSFLVPRAQVVVMFYTFVSICLSCDHPFQLPEFARFCFCPNVRLNVYLSVKS